MDNLVQSFKDSLHKGFIDQNIVERTMYKPELLINNETKNINVLNSLIHELRMCKSFIFSVAFITEDGLATLKTHLLELKEKGVQGRILTSDYLYFNTPEMFKELLKLENVSLRVTNTKGFHAKGYIFEQKNYHSLIIGSSNLTTSALKVNYEWNVKLNSLNEGEFVNHFKQQFEDIWSESTMLTNEWIEAYKVNYEKYSIKQNFTNKINTTFNEIYETKNSIKTAYEIKPNKMQEAALIQIAGLRKKNLDKGLIISATGTGKTYLSAFDIRAYQPKRMLFIVHREQILLKALEDFKRVLGGKDEDFGVLSGNRKDYTAKYLFATIQTISKENYLQHFRPEEFDYILIDEVHKAGAASYESVLKYFKPNFLLGMTATPERTDDYNIYKLFDYNIAYEIRLQEALEEDMLCPFHYFGVTDLEYVGEVTNDAQLISKLVAEERVEHLIEKITYYGYSGKQVQGLIFCSRKVEAVELSKVLNERGYRTRALTGANSQDEREKAIEMLENGALEYILTVDIFNEGIDIPSLNQIVMLRQTESSIIFIQQLGRGLRKHESKDYVTIIDFIANYNNNYLIPVALSGDESQNKDNLRRHVQDTSYIKGISNINFEEIARKRIFESINRAKLTAMKIYDEAYRNLKNKIGRVPYLRDFYEYNSIDPVSILSKFNNYYHFLRRGEENIFNLTTYEDQVLSMISLELVNGKRPHELILLKMLLENNYLKKDAYIKKLKERNIFNNEDTFNSVKRIFNLEFYTKGDVKKYGGEPLIYFKNDIIYFNEKIQAMIKNNNNLKKLIEDAIETGILKGKEYEQDKQLTLYKKYTKKDVCRLLNWEKDEKGTMYGYRIKHGTAPIFITYHKDEDVESSVDYGDEFLNRDTLLWYTRNQRTLESNEVKEVLYADKYDNTIHVFVKKDDDEGTDFYYLGQANPKKETAEETVIRDNHNKERPIVRMNLILEKEIELPIYEYLIEE